MSLMIELLASTHEADLLRASRERRLRRIVTACRRRILGVLPIGPTCEPRTTC